VQAHVLVPLGGSGVTPDDVYARRISAGWVFPSENLHHFLATLTLGDMHDDQEHPDPLDISDCECAFFFANLDRAPDEWGRLSDFDQETCQSKFSMSVFPRTPSTTGMTIRTSETES
jgi:hypothetical protein